MKKSTDNVNASVLKRTVEGFVEIVESAGHATVYVFDLATSAWKRKGVEGPLFVYRRSYPPFYGFIILNRHAKNNFEEDLVPDIEFQITDSFIIYKNQKDEVHGLWFYNSQEKERFASIAPILTQKSTETLKQVVQPEVAVPHTIEAPRKSSLQPFSHSTEEASPVSLEQKFARAAQRAQTSPLQIQPIQQPQPAQPLQLTPTVLSPTAYQVNSRKASRDLTPRESLPRVDSNLESYQAKQDQEYPLTDIPISAFKPELFKRLENFSKEPSGSSLLLTPADLRRKGSERTVLSKQAFRQNLLVQIQTNQAFVESLYNQYLASVSSSQSF